MIWTGKGFIFDLDRRVVLMGVLNVTPDSFSDGGRYFACDQALARAMELLEEGADLLDVGGESSRPGAQPVPMDEELRRVLPLIEAVRKRSEVPLSIDTYKAGTARAALEAGANIINDITALSDPEMATVAAQHQAGLILMHMQGNPQTMQKKPEYSDLFAEVISYLRAAVERALAAGVSSQSIAVDPGIGFGKTTDHNLRLLNGLSRIAELGYPVLVGPSRKRFIGELTGQEVSNRLFGTLAATALAVDAGARIIRIHDVAPVRQAVRVAEAVHGAAV